MKKIFYLLLTVLISSQAFGQSANDLLNLLISNKSITQEQADSLRADAAIKQQEADAKKKSFPVSAGKALQLSGYTQLRYQNLEEKGKVSGFDIRRARLDAKGTISPYWGYRIQFDLAGSPKLLDAYAEWKVEDYLVVTFGQFRVPLSAESNAPDNTLESINRSQVVEALAGRSKDVIGDHNGRDIGVQVGGSFLQINDLNLIEYKVGVFNGYGINRADGNNNKAIAGRIVLHPLKGIDIGSSAYNGKTPYSTTDKNHARTRFGVDAGFEYKDLTLRAEYLQGKDSSNVKRSGYFAQAGYYILPKELQVLLKYDTFNPNTDNSSAKNNYFTDYITGLTYTIASNTRIQAAYTVRREKHSQINNNFAVVQLQIGF